MARRLTGSEPFTSKAAPLPVSVLDFWQWVGSDLLDNALRGKLAEFLVGQALGCLEAGRREWDAYDLMTEDGIKIEVKSASYVQTWHQSKPSKISFRIKPTQAWDAATNEWATEVCRSADVYVFCVLAEQDADLVDPMNLDQWNFYVISTAALDQAVAGQATITLGRLTQLEARKVDYASLAEVVSASAARLLPDRQPDFS